MTELLSVINISLWQIFVAAANLLVLFLILKFLLFRKVKIVIDNRENEVKTLFDDAETAKEEALQLKADYEKNIANAKDKALEIINDATLSASKRADAIINEANTEATSIKQKSFTAIDLEKKKAIDEIKTDISSLVTAAAAKVIEKEIDVDTHKKLIDDFVNQVGE